MNSLPAHGARLEGRATIADVAKVAGVSKATVSRFLNHRDTLLTPGIAARVEKAVAALAYLPSPMAQALKRGRSKLIGLVVADIANPFSVAVLRGAEKAAQEAGYLVMLFNLGNASGREREGIEALASYQVEGFILNTLGGDVRSAGEVARHGKPAVLIDRKQAGLQADFVSLDNADAVQQAFDHLVGHGYRELLYVTERVADISSRIERKAAFQQCLGAAGEGIAGHTVELETADGGERPGVGSGTAGREFEAGGEGGGDVGGGLVGAGGAGAGAGADSHAAVAHRDADATLDTALRDLKRRAGKRPAAVMASNALVTLRVAAAVARLGWRFGRDIGFVGIDETDWAPLVGDGLTTIAQPTDDIGRVAASCLLERLQGRDLPLRQIRLTGRLVPRASSRPVRKGR